MKHRHGYTPGFTLIELLVVIAVIGILAAIVVPNYADYVTRSKIAEATATLSETRVKLEQYFQDNRSYVGACLPNTIAPQPTGKYFAYTCDPAPTATTFTVTATGVAAEGMGNFVYTINERNIRTTTGLPAGWSGVNTNCWVTKKSGAC